MKDLVVIEQLPQVPADWNYEESVARVRQVIYKWKNLTLELATELYIARQALSRPGRPYGRHTWREYCDEIDTNQIVVNRWLARWFQPKQKFMLPPRHNEGYRTIIIDPPWPIKKILREARPNQAAELDYYTMSIDEIKEFPISDFAANDGCHIYLWTTHRFLPVAFEVFNAWGVNYECLLTWVKNVGFTPYSWMYSTEHCLFGRLGDLPLLKKGERLDFFAPVREHSRKPDEFYNRIRDVSPEPRIDIFSREKREGFDQYGDEITKFTAKEKAVAT